MGKITFFVSKEEFLTMVERDELLEYALVYGDYKGIPKQQIREFMAKGHDVVLRLDTEGAATVRRILGSSAVRPRLIDRKTETKETLLVRVVTAREEVKHLRKFDYVVVNEEGRLERSAGLVEAIIDAEKARVLQRNAVILGWMVSLLVDKGRMQKDSDGVDETDSHPKPARRFEARRAQSYVTVASNPTQGGLRANLDFINMDVESGNESGSDRSTRFRWRLDAPGAKLISFASRLAMLEKAAAGLGALGFIWASVAVVKESRSSRETVGTAEDTGEREPVDTAEDTDERRHVNWITRERVISTKTGMFSLVLYWFQPASSTTCVILSSMKLIKHICDDVGDANERNQQLALNIFFSLALGEALLFLLEKAFSEWMIKHRKLLEEVNRECHLDPLSIIYVRRFFYDTYPAFVNESIFYGRQKDLVSFAMDLLASNVFEDQLNGARILRKFATNENFSDATLQKVGIATSVMARLVEMLNWKEVEEEEIRQSVAEILLKLAGPRHKAPQITGIPGVMESISSLLLDSRDSAAASDGISVTMMDFQIERCDLLDGIRIYVDVGHAKGAEAAILAAAFFTATTGLFPTAIGSSPASRAK
ncbi:hypothetical protein RJ639_007015 [Escallonia herrerae]|uniref:Guanylate kinase-like domain-containing protein n=1 Tax=Escallonia herrerae TaxID=1293975 RepID=A0AA88W2Z9_9ASTE|nr:hypothetical protein RJ639_007015 [Escallonia herrerae]